MNNIKYKLELCKHFSTLKGCYKGDKCSFAHGESDILKRKCLSDIKCWNENCIYNHPEGWNPDNNKDPCLICRRYNNVCNKENPKYKHINNINIKEVEKDNLEMPKDNEFPDIIKNKTSIDLNKEKTFKYSDILKSNLNDNNINETYKKELLNEENNVENIKQQITNNYMLLKELDPADWSNYDEIDNINEDINILEKKMNKIKKESKNDMFEDNLNLDIIFIEDDNKDEKSIQEDVAPDINLSINIYETKDNKEIIKCLICRLEKEIELYNKKIKKQIDNTIQNDYFKFILINNLNEISSKINLLKNNYEDNIY